MEDAYGIKEGSLGTLCKFAIKVDVVIFAGCIGTLSAGPKEAHSHLIQLSKLESKLVFLFAQDLDSLLDSQSGARDDASRADKRHVDGLVSPKATKRQTGTPRRAHQSAEKRSYDTTDNTASDNRMSSLSKGITFFFGERHDLQFVTLCL